MMPFIRLFHFRGSPAAGVRTGVIILLMTVVSAAGFAVGANEPMTPSATAAAEAGMPAKPDASAEGMETAVLAGGCFWGVEAVFDPEIITFDLLLEVFFNIAHDPTQLNFQGPDVGTQYRSVVFYNSNEQKQTTNRVIEKLDAEGSIGKAIVTEVVPLAEFYPAEDYHQDFMRRNPRHPYIAYWDLPKIKHLEEAYPELLKEQ